ncbi:MAG: hypothetical protein K5790_08200 [Nitrosopumilus sp.]|uniref:hypothetical protein n=1 Tax=Nitrosopumilus sp. TaxID=2024843 RepID=UPI00247D4B68|nr:hypothetical protein [Nitrosopumilus sp.]MCV0393249.1 hypothetical protein [Nitrosopumilus sp.]
MNRTKTIAVFAGIFAIAMTTYGLSGVSASPLVLASIPQASEGMTTMGHVEYTLYDADQRVKQYVQGDNFVVETGTDCVGEYVFGTTDSATCTSTGTAFQYVAIGNATTPDAATTDSELDTDGGSGCASSTVDGEQARKLVDVSQTDNSGSGTEVVLDTLTDTFKFDSTNATTVTQSGVFNDQVGTVAANGSCGTLGASGTDWEMFAIKDLSPSVVTSAGDTLAVQWTITIN